MKVAFLADRKPESSNTLQAFLTEAFSVDVEVASFALWNLLSRIGAP